MSSGDAGTIDAVLIEVLVIRTKIVMATDVNPKADNRIRFYASLVTLLVSNACLVIITLNPACGNCHNGKPRRLSIASLYMQNNVYRGSATEFLVGEPPFKRTEGQKVKIADQTFVFDQFSTCFLFLLPH